jgi:hypothetical protein
MVLSLRLDLLEIKQTLDSNTLLIAHPPVRYSHLQANSRKAQQPIDCIFMLFMVNFVPCRTLESKKLEPKSLLGFLPLQLLTA